MNPMALMKLMSAKNKFNANHPKVGAFFKAAFGSGLQEGTILELTVPESLPVNESLRAYQVPTSSIKDRTFLKMNLPAVSLQAFTNETFIFMKQENNTGKRAARICQEHHFHPRVLFELDQQMTSYNVTCSGMGISFIGDLLISLVPPNPNVVYYRLDEKDSLRNIYFYWKKGRYISHTMSAFLDLLSSFDNLI